MIKFNKPRNANYCWSISKAILKEFKEIRIGIDDETDEAVIKTIDRDSQKSRPERSKYRQAQRQNFYR